MGVRRREPRNGSPVHRLQIRDRCRARGVTLGRLHPRGVTCGSGPCARVSSWRFSCSAQACGASPGSPSATLTPRLATGPADCPPVPGDVSALRSVSRAARLACFSGRPITVQARLVGCNCDVDGGGYEPGWFSGGSQPLLLIDPSETSAPDDANAWLIVRLDRAGRYPSVLPVGHVVAVTGMFDHPAALACVFEGVPTDTETPAPMSDCRYMFATTVLAAVE